MQTIIYSEKTKSNRNIYTTVTFLLHQKQANLLRQKLQPVSNAGVVAVTTIHQIKQFSQCLLYQCHLIMCSKVTYTRYNRLDNVL
jgi:hypothetical protein